MSRPPTNVGVTCIEERCNKPAKARQMCQKHYELDRATHQPRCSVKGCNERLFANAMCKRHNKRAWNVANADRVKEKLANGPRCNQPGCKNPATSRGLCATHRYRARHYGDPSTVLVKMAVVYPDGTVECLGCGQRLPLDAFARKSAVKGTGRASRCKACESAFRKTPEFRRARNERRRARWASDPEYRRREIDASLAYVRNSPEAKVRQAIRLQEQKHLRRVMGEGREKGIHLDSIRDRDGDLCVWCHEPMEFGAFWLRDESGNHLLNEHGKWRKNPEAATVEHLHELLRKDGLGNYTSPGHSWENVALAHLRCNKPRRYGLDYEWAVWPKSRSTLIQVKRDEPPLKRES